MRMKMRTQLVCACSSQTLMLACTHAYPHTVFGLAHDHISDEEHQVLQFYIFMKDRRGFIVRLPIPMREKEKARGERDSEREREREGEKESETE